MKFYYCYRVTYHNGTRISGSCGKMLLEEEPIDETISFSWDNLDKLYANYGMSCAFNLYSWKKGRVVEFFCNSLFPRGDFKPLKEWKHPDLNITLNLTYKEYTPSIDEILKWYDGERAILYLREKGLNICPKG